MIDCSHANASKVARNQIKVWNNIFQQRKKANGPITDACLDWETTEQMLGM